MTDKNLIDLKPYCYVEYSPVYDVFMVMFKGVPLWATIYPTLDECEIHLNECEDEICIVGKTKVYGYDDSYDISTYGMWFSYESAAKWLADPEPLY